MRWRAEVAADAAGRQSKETSISLAAYMMSPGEDKIVGDRIYEILAAKRPAKSPEAPKAPAGDLTGRWDVHIEYAAGSSDHILYVKQQGNQLIGTHQGDFVSRDFAGTISGDDLRITSNVSDGHGASMSYHFTGKVDGDKLSGSLEMGEYLGAKWTAKRHTFGRQA